MEKIKIDYSVAEALIVTIFGSEVDRKMFDRVNHRRNAEAEYKLQFQQQRCNARSRTIPFRLTFDQWLKVWHDSGKLSERGKGDNKYCMARLKDSGAYEIGNVYITTFTGNITDGYFYRGGRKYKGAK